MSHFVYMLRCKGNRVYTGYAVDVEAREVQGFDGGDDVGLYGFLQHYATPFLFLCFAISGNGVGIFSSRNLPTLAFR